MNRRYSLFNQADSGAGLNVENGGTVLSTETAGLSIARTIRGNIPQTEGTHTVTFIVYADPGLTAGELAALSIANKVSIGIASGAASLAQYVGGNTESIGYRVAEGQIHTGGSSIESVAAGGLGSIVKVSITIQDDGTGQIAWRLNRTLLSVQDIPAGMIGDDLYWAVSLGSDDNAGDILVQVNSGANQMEDAQSPEAGWWEPVSVGASVRVASENYVSHHDDDLPSVRWESGVKPDGVDVRSVSFWWWGSDRQVQGSVETREITDPDGRLDYLLAGTFRDQPVTRRVVPRFRPLSEAVNLGLRYFERCEVVDDLTKRIVLKDIISLLDLRLQDRFIRPDADPSSANTAWPLLIGKGLNVDPPLLDADGLDSDPMPVFALDSEGVDQLGKVRVEGQPLDVNVPDYALIDDGQALQLYSKPDGILTLDMSKTGSAYTPPSPVDALGGTGNPFTGINFGAITDWTAFEDNGALPPGTYTPVYVNPGIVAFPQITYARSHIESDVGTLVAGTRYRWQFTVTQMPNIDTFTMEAEVGLTLTTDRFNAYALVNGFNFRDGNPGLAPRTFSGTYTAPITHSPRVFFTGNERNTGAARIRDLTFIELPPLDDSGDNDEVEFALPALTLEEGMRMVIEEAAGMSETMWLPDSAAAVDAETGHLGGNYYAREQGTRREALEAMMPGYTSSIYRTRDGKLAVARAVIPEDVYLSSTGADWELDQTGMLTQLIPSRDEGRGLTRRIGCRRNERVLDDSNLDTAASGVTLPLRAQFARRWRTVVATGAPLAAGYEHADAADPLDTRLMLPPEAQIEADYMARAYRIGRSFYEVRIPWRDEVDLMTVGLVSYNRYGMTSGIPMVVVAIQENSIKRTMDLTLWGPSPYEDWQ